MSRMMMRPLAWMLAAIPCFPAAASAAELAPLQPCYVRVGDAVQGIAVNARGFTPNSTVTLAVDGQVRAGGNAVQVSALGTVDLPAELVPAPNAHRRPRPFAVSLTENGNPANSATATSMIAKLRVAVEPERARPARQVRFFGSGFLSDGPVWAHYIFRDKVRRTVRMERPSGPCGTWSMRRAHMPIRRPQPGNWMVQFSQSRRFSNRTAQNAWLRIEVRMVRRG